MRYLGWIFLFLAGPAMACEPVIDTAFVSLTECAGPREGRELTLKIGGEGGFGLRADFAETAPAQLFRNLHPLPGTRALTGADQRALLNASRGKALGSSATSLVQFIARFAAPGFLPREKEIAPSLKSATTLLCENLGKPRTGYFTARGQAWRQTMILGSHGCMGKCGLGCGIDGDWSQGQYTQECFDHDLCVTMTGENMGDCEDEFWAAASGFLSAPFCMFVDKDGNRRGVSRGRAGP